MDDLPELPAIRRSRRGGFFLDAQATYYPNFARVYIPKFALPKGSAEAVRTAIDRIENPDIPASETNLERSLRRTRKNIKGYLLCNKFEHFVTLTIASDRQDIQRSKDKITNWVKNEKKRKGKFDYLIVPEFHKDGQSLHFHAVFRGYTGVVEQSLREDGEPLKQKGRLVYNYPSYTLGFNNVKLIDDQQDSATKVAYYLQKYVTKDMPILFGKNRYRASYGLRKPIVEDNPQHWYKVAKPDWTYDNEHGIILDFEVGKNPLVDMYIKANWS